MGKILCLVQSCGDNATKQLRLNLAIYSKADRYRYPIDLGIYCCAAHATSQIGEQILNSTAAGHEFKQDIERALDELDVKQDPTLTYACWELFDNIGRVVH